MARVTHKHTLLVFAEAAVAFSAQPRRHCTMLASDVLDLRDVSNPCHATSSIIHPLHLAEFMHRHKVRVDMRMSHTELHQQTPFTATEVKNHVSRRQNGSFLQHPE